MCLKMLRFIISTRLHELQTYIILMKIPRWLREDPPLGEKGKGVFLLKNMAF